MDDAEVRAVEHATYRGGEDRVPAPRPEIPYVLARAERHVNGRVPVDVHAALVRDAGLRASRLPPGARTSAAPAGRLDEIERELRSALRHGRDLHFEQLESAHLIARVRHDRVGLAGSYSRSPGSNAATARQATPTQIRMKPGRVNAPVCASLTNRLCVTASGFVCGKGSASSPTTATQMPTTSRICFARVTRRAYRACSRPCADRAARRRARRSTGAESQPAQRGAPTVFSTSRSPRRRRCRRPRR